MSKIKANSLIMCFLSLWSIITNLRRDIENVSGNSKSSIFDKVPECQPGGPAYAAWGFQSRPVPPARNRETLRYMQTEWKQTHYFICLIAYVIHSNYRLTTTDGNNGFTVNSVSTISYLFHRYNTVPINNQDVILKRKGGLMSSEWPNFRLEELNCK